MVILIGWLKEDDQSLRRILLRIELYFEQMMTNPDDAGWGWGGRFPG
jgi:hypothetical protein